MPRSGRCHRTSKPLQVKRKLHHSVFRGQQILGRNYQLGIKIRRMHYYYPFFNLIFSVFLQISPTPIRRQPPFYNGTDRIHFSEMYFTWSLEHISAPKSKNSLVQLCHTPFILHYMIVLIPSELAFFFPMSFFFPCQNEGACEIEKSSIKGGHHRGHWLRLAQGYWYSCTSCTLHNSGVISPCSEQRLFFITIFWQKLH